ncbi:transcriptional regulator PpsR [Sulfitobacter sp. D35]|uniref:transcriptional regulator PpsR n=1 Tax=Sulfitobacter sp. D35 TaxID=3083252 RepID=UPI00296FBE0F|nr:transcriptional regulator PpsR [Sulfitobacter sp. D35]MDW4499393.1 transcriptional regulator PpsR [Sulfitobacter sp. D35]
MLPDPVGIPGLIEKASDIAIHIDAAGTIEGISVNPECPSLGCLDHWVGRDIDKFLTVESREKLARRLDDMRNSADGTVPAVEINHVDNATWEFPIRYSLHSVKGDSVLMIGRDMGPIAEVQQRLVSEQLARERDLKKLRGEETFYRLVLEAAETPIVIVEPEQGVIRDLNGPAASLFGTKAETLSGSMFAQVFEGRRRGELVEALKAAASASEVRSVEVSARRNGRALHLTPEFFRAAGDLYLLCRVKAVDEDAEDSVQSAHSLAALFTATTDAIVLTDAKGVIRDANEAFLVMADAPQLRDIRDRSLAEFLVRGSVDLKLILESAAKPDRLRSYATQLKSVFGTRANVELSAARLHQRGGDLGFGIVVRDVTPSERIEAQANGAAVSEEAMRNVMDLVGTASLKELVSATSDVVEKMCIETAVQLTGNNRVAAAEMLGLSRQSLYVKLRKHGLLASNAEE